MENPAQGGASGCQSFRYDTGESSAHTHDPQAAARAIEAGLIALPDSSAMAVILRRRLDERERLWLAASALLALPPETAEELAEAALHDLRAGEPDIPFLSIRDAAASWATFASRQECCHYLAAIWNMLDDDDRKRFLRRAI